MDSQTKKNKCSSCDYCLVVWYGYSNWTVEGADVYCTLGLNPDSPYDKWYGEDKRDLFASSCPKFSEEFGPAYIDVDRQDLARTPHKKGSYFGKPKEGPDKWEHYETPFISRHKIEEFVTE